MAFADPRVCPDCRGPIDGTPVCPSCGLDLRDPQVRELWQTLLHADSLLVAATRRRDAAHAAIRTPPQQSFPTQQPPPLQQPAASRPPAPPAAPAQPGPPPTQPSGMPSYPGAAPAFPGAAPAFDTGPSFPAPPPLEPAAARERSWSVGTVLLGLGAIGLVVAAVIFVSRSWDSIGLIGKSLVLAAATAAVTAAAVWVTRRPLRSSAEALWAVALVLAAVDLLGARGEGLFGLDAVPWSWIAAVTGAVIAVLGGAVILRSRRWLEADLITPGVAATAGIVLAGSGASAIGDLRDFWHAFVALIVSGLLGLALRFSRSAVIAWGARVVVAAWFGIAAVLAVQEAVEQPSLDSLVTEGRGVPLLVVSLAALVVAATVPVVRIVMTAVAVAGLGLLVALPFGDLWSPEGGWVAVSVLVALVACVGSLGGGAWLLGLRWGASFGGLFVLGLALWWVTDALHVAASAFDRFGELGSTVRVDSWVGEFDPVATIVIAVALAVSVWAALRWLEEPTDRVRAVALASATAVGVLGSVLAFDPPWWLLATALTAIAALAATVAVRRVAPAVFWVAGAAGLLALGVSVAAQPVMAATWIVLALGAAAVVAGPEALLVPVVPLRRSLAAVVAPVLTGGLAVGVAAADGRQATSALVAVVGAALVLVAAARAPAAVRPYLEGGAAAALVVSAVSPDSSLIASIGFTIIGVTACAIAAATVDRRWYVWPGIAAFVVAYILLIVDSGFGFVEAYTLPLAAIVLGGGVVLLRRTPSMNSWVALGPGLVLALLPSLPQALADPTGLRALLLGLAAVVVLAVGARLGRQAPFLLGVGVAALVLVFNIGPYANAAPRVLIISIVSALFIGLGVTWEDRVRDGRKVMSFVKEMR